MLTRTVRFVKQPCTASAVRSLHAKRFMHAGQPSAARALDVDLPVGSTTIEHTLSSPLRMLLIGAPGAGKGTQSGRLQRDHGLSALSSGDLLRAHVRQQTEIGRAAAAVMARGELVPDTLMIRLILAEMQRLRSAHWLLDGFPRNVAQAAALDQSLHARDSPLNLVVSLQVPDEVILERILARWIHAPSGRVYNLGYNPPRVPGRDDVTGEPLTRRADDTKDVFRARMQAFRATTLPLLEHYDRQGVLVELRGDTSDTIYAQLQQVLAAHTRTAADSVAEDWQTAMDLHSYELEDDAVVITQGTADKRAALHTITANV